MAGRIDRRLTGYWLGQEIPPGTPIVIRGVSVEWVERPLRVTDHATGLVTESTWLAATWQGQPLETVWLDDAEEAAIEELLEWAADQAAELSVLWRAEHGVYGDGEDGGAEWLSEGIDISTCPDPTIRNDPTTAFELIEPLFVAALAE
jgi:hypothetical protein